VTGGKQILIGKPQVISERGKGVRHCTFLLDPGGITEILEAAVLRLSQTFTIVSLTLKNRRDFSTFLQEN